MVRRFHHCIPTSHCLRYLMRLIKIIRHKEEQEEDVYTRWEKDYDLVPQSVHGLFYEYLELGACACEQNTRVFPQKILYYVVCVVKNSDTQSQCTCVHLQYTQTCLSLIRHSPSLLHLHTYIHTYST